jgi:hypothetical protein
MFGLAVEKKNETEERRLENLRRLTAVLAYGDGIGFDCIVNAEPGRVNPPPSPDQASLGAR